MTTRFGLVGLGQISHYWLKAIAADPNLVVTAVCDLTKPNTLPDGVEFFNNHLDLVNSKKVDVLILCTPPSVRLGIFQDALKAGVKVISEKPLETSLEKGLAAFQLAKTHKTPIYLAYHSIFGPTFLATKELVLQYLGEGDKVTKVFTHCVEFGDEQKNPTAWHWNPAIAGGGCLIDCGINQLSIICDLLGGLKPVSCSLQIPSYSKVEGLAKVEFETMTEPPAKVSLINDWITSGDHFGIYEFEFESQRKIKFEWCSGLITLTEKDSSVRHVPPLLFPTTFSFFFLFLPVPNFGL